MLKKGGGKDPSPRAGEKEPLELGRTQTDLTQGGISRQLAHFAAPMVVTSLLQAAYSVTDMVLADRLVGSAGLSAINNAGQVSLFITQVIIGITTGGNILISQYFGSRREEDRARTTAALFALSLIMGLFLTGAIYPFSGRLMAALRAPALEEATLYFRICVMGIVPIFGYNACAAVIRAAGNSRVPLLVIAATAGANIALDFLLMGPMRLGVAGAALATVLSQTLSFLLSFAYLMRHRGAFGLRLAGLRISGDKMAAILKLGVPCAVQMTVAGISWMSVTFLINSYGVHVSAGNGIAAKIKDVCQLLTIAMTTAASTMIAQNLGAAKFDRAKQVVYTTMKITLGISLCTIAVTELFAPGLVGLFASDPRDAAAAVENLRIEILAQVFFAVFLSYHALALGAGHTLFVLASSFTNCILVRMVLAFLFEAKFGLRGIYWACMIAPSVSIPMGWLYMRSHVWRRSLAGGAGPEKTPEEE